ncbi:hypothetical protein [Neisseria gonorrhoeae]|nr:hypothetical protein F9Z35_1879 [Neisseria gonorrhoeae]
MQVVAVGFIIGVIPDSAETALILQPTFVYRCQPIWADRETVRNKPSYAV